MSIQKDIKELLGAGVITDEVAERLETYYEGKKGSSSNRLLVIFGVLGAILVGLGIILILASNWDDFPKSAKTFFAFLPLVIGQGLGAYALLKKRDSPAWTESSSAFLFFAIGASISLISQIYNIEGDLGFFLMTWSLLALPIIYLLRSSIASLLYIGWVTWFGVVVGYDHSDASLIMYWLMFMAVIPHVVYLFRQKPESNFLSFHNWMLPGSVAIMLGTFADGNEYMLVLAYFALFSLFYGLGELKAFSRRHPATNGPRIIGLGGMISMLMAFSFDEIWKEMSRGDFDFVDRFLGAEFPIALILVGGSLTLLFLGPKEGQKRVIRPFGWTLLAFIPIFVIGQFTVFATLLINVLILVMGILTIREGTQKEHLGILNFGLLIITTLVICRFFDTELPFLVRGLLFVAVGVGFFVANYLILKKRKKDE